MIFIKSKILNLKQIKEIMTHRKRRFLLGNLIDLISIRYNFRICCYCCCHQQSWLSSHNRLCYSCFFELLYNKSATAICLLTLISVSPGKTWSNNIYHLAIHRVCLDIPNRLQIHRNYACEGS